jgi:hypothetical protein
MSTPAAIASVYGAISTFRSSSMVKSMVTGCKSVCWMFIARPETSPMPPSALSATHPASLEHAGRHYIDLTQLFDGQVNGDWLQIRILACTCCTKAREVLSGFIARPETSPMPPSALSATHPASLEHAGRHLSARSSRPVLVCRQGARSILAHLCCCHFWIGGLADFLSALYWPVGCLSRGRRLRRCLRALFQQLIPRRWNMRVGIYQRAAVGRCHRVR